MLEYNADTLTSLLEAAVIQWTWNEDVHSTTDQFNSIHEREEDWVTSARLPDTLMQARRAATIMALCQLGWDPERRVFVDERGRPIERIFKLHTREWIMREEFGVHLPECCTTFVEPLLADQLALIVHNA